MDKALTHSVRARVWISRTHRKTRQVGGLPVISALGSRKKTSRTSWPARLARIAEVSIQWEAPPQLGMGGRDWGRIHMRVHTHFNSHARVHTYMYTHTHIHFPVLGLNCSATKKEERNVSTCRWFIHLQNIGANSQNSRTFHWYYLINCIAS